nr:asparagine synthase (glutamine-hydrolyzing) [Thermoleophilaceae bacterium]
GFAFTTETDTEVLLAMYVRYGEDMLPLLNGMFAFAIWDDLEKRLFLARDRLGIKPLYYTELADGALAFASEVKSLLPALPSVSVRPEAIADFLTFLWVPDPTTIFQGVYKLAPGHCATWSAGSFDVTQWWDMTFEPQEHSEDEWSVAVRAEISRSVRRQTVSDVPLGSFLSGGIDSSAIVADLHATLGGVTTYTVGFDPEDMGHEIVPDDLRYSRQLAKDMALDYHERILSADVADLLPKLIWHLDEPVADPAAISTYLICSSARDSLTVVMSGMGGDEVFAGYPRHVAMKLARMLDPAPRRFRGALGTVLEERIGLGPPGRMRGPRRNLMKFGRGLGLPPDERYLAYCSYYRGGELDTVLSPDLRQATADHDSFACHRAHLDHVRGEHWLNRLLYLDMKTFLPCLNLAYTDKMSMAASAEVRVPLLDDQLVALGGRIPPELKLKRLTRKHILKRAMADVLPKEIVHRPKAGFGAPLRSWLVKDLAPMIDDLLSPEAVRSRGLLDPAEVARIIKANREGSEDNALRMWALMTLELWHHEFVDSPVPTT